MERARLYPKQTIKVYKSNHDKAQIMYPVGYKRADKLHNG